METLCTMLSDLYKDIYYAGGSHELLQRRRREYEVMLRFAGVHILQGESAVVNGVRIIGQRDRGRGKRFWSSFTKEYQGNEPVILLEHRPESVEESLDVQLLQLFGYMHSGRIFLNIVLIRISYPRAYGNYDVGYRMLVSSGAGTQGFPARVAPHNEILFATVWPK